uniref:Rab-GAP TBC domain-containing protein n=1 Tax=Macrostomum lignano TaxID=282301 RepID=A0A1I8G8Z1_9PLAT
MSVSAGATSAPRRTRERALTIDIMSTLSRLANSATKSLHQTTTSRQQQQQNPTDYVNHSNPAAMPPSDGSLSDSQSFVSESSIEGSHTNLQQLVAATSAATPSASASNGVLLRKKNSIRKEWKRSPSISNSYADEWERMFLSHGEGDLLLYLKELCCSGELRNCRFRSVVWRLALRVLSSDAAKWKEETQAWRSRYSELKQQHCIDISKLSRSPDSQATDLRVHNPLSQDSRSPWYRFFRSEETRHIIYQDVRRTFPEIQYFHAADVQEKMISTLFCFAHTSPLLYRQGMHEVLAPLLFVLHSDQLAFQHACELYSATPPVMELVPFAKPAEDRNGNPIVEKLATIGERILRVHDLELYLHLEKLEVAPHLYGIRWMRLLFGREFPLQDLLVVWDAVFADGYDAGFGLVDYIFVAMLINIRSLLLASDFSGAMTYLMRYPQGSDVNFIVSLAYHLRAPDAYPKPSLTGFQ